MAQNVYQKVQYILQMDTGTAKKGNDLLKIQLDTKDDRLRALIAPVVRMYRLYVPPGHVRRTDGNPNIPYNNNRWHELLKPLKKELDDYCFIVCQRDEPEWQIAAKQAGWTSPEKLRQSLNTLRVETQQCLLCQKLDPELISVIEQVLKVAKLSLD